MNVTILYGEDVTIAGWTVSTEGLPRYEAGAVHLLRRRDGLVGVLVRRDRP
jgi:hypothetical protein